MGGNLYWSAGLSLLFPLPYLPDDIVKGHVFTNAGSLLKSWTEPLISKASVSAGCGFIVRFQNIRFELNFCVPVRMQSSDSFKSGIQFGIGMGI